MPGPLTWPIPPSEASYRELETIRRGETQGQSAAKVLEDRAMFLASAAVAFVVIGLALYFLIFAAGSVHVSLTGLQTSEGACYGPRIPASLQDVTYAFTLTNTGSRTALAMVEFMADGFVAGQISYTIPPGASLHPRQTFTVPFCGVTDATADISRATSV